MSTVQTTGAALKEAAGGLLGEGTRLRWAILVAHTDDGQEVVLSGDELGNEFDLLRIAQEFNLALKGLTYRALSDIYGEANKEETP